jgi:hypothetical protein
VEGPCEHGNEPSGSIKCWEIPKYLPKLAASQEGLSSMELVREKYGDSTLSKTAKTASFEILSKPLLTNHTTIRHYKV